MKRERERVKDGDSVYVFERESMCETECVRER